MQKDIITQAIEQRLKEIKLSKRGLAQQMGVKHPHIIRITNGENYTINSLIEVLDSLGLKIQIVKGE